MHCRLKTIEQTLVDPSSAAACTFSDLAGMHAAKQVAVEALMLPAKYPHLFQGQSQGDVRLSVSSMLQEPAPS